MTPRLPILIAVAIAAVPAGWAVLRAQTSAPTPGAASSTVEYGPSNADAPIQDAPDVAAVAPVAPAQLLAESRAMLARHRSIVAKIRHHAELYERDVRGNGRYLQGPASSRLMRYELSLQSGERGAHFLEVNDGRFLWRRTQFKEEPDVERVDVDTLLSALQRAGGAAVADPALLLGVGGLGRLLETLERDFDFSKSLPPGSLDGLPVYGIAGLWRPAALQKYGVASTDALRPHVPDHVVLFLGRDDYFPYQIEFRRTVDGAGEGTGPDWRPLLKMELFEVQFDVPFDATLFHFAAEHLSYVDVTQQTIAQLTKPR